MVRKLLLCSHEWNPAAETVEVEQRECGSGVMKIGEENVIGMRVRGNKGTDILARP